MKRTQSYKKEIRINGRRLTKRFTRLTDADRWYAEKKREKELVESGLTPTAQETLLADYTATWLARRRQQGKPQLKSIYFFSSRVGSFIMRTCEG